MIHPSEQNKNFLRSCIDFRRRTYKDNIEKCENYCADRIEAARKREREPVTACHAIGNAAALREACQKMLDLLMLHGDGKARCILTWDEFNESQKMLRAALSAPPRNCNIYTTAEEADRAITEYCSKMAETGECVKSCPHREAEGGCAFGWILAPAAERKGEGDGK